MTGKIFMSKAGGWESLTIKRPTSIYVSQLVLQVEEHQNRHQNITANRHVNKVLVVSQAIARGT